MKHESASQMVPVAAVTRQLRMTREQVIRRIQTGDLAGRRDERRGWLVDPDSAEAFARRSDSSDRRPAA